MESKNRLITTLDSVVLLLLVVLFVGFPLVFLPLSTDAFSISKQLLLGVVAALGFILWGVKMVLEKTIKLKQTPFTLPVVLFVSVAFISSLLAVNKYDSLLSFVPLLFAVCVYFLIGNFVKTPKAFFVVVSSLVATSAVLAVHTVLSFAKIYVLPFSFSNVQNFTPVGSYLDLAIILLLVLPIAVYFIVPMFRTRSKAAYTPVALAAALATVVIAVGLLVTVYGLATQFTPRILPFETGFQTAFAAISQDPNRTVQGLLFGTGYGTYSADFSRFKQAAFNLHADLWNLQFIRSSSFALELLSTTGILGLGAFIFLLTQFIRGTSSEKKHNPLYISLFVAFALAFVLPFSLLITTFFFVILGLFVATQNYPDVKIHFTALSEGLFSTGEKRLPVLSYVVLLVFLVLTLFLSYYEYRFVTSDLTFQESLVTLSQNNGSKAYDLQNKALTTFPYRDFYHRSFSQLNLALANSLASSIPQGGSPSAQTQQTITTLIQQSISSARSAAAVSPQTALNWQNLSSIYRSLIGFGENAEQFAILAQQQAISLDSTNPQQYIILGGLYYQLQQWDAAIRQFAVATNLKPDFANAYYNLGHALESKGDLQNALVQYQTVKRLVIDAEDKTNAETIDKEIKALEQKIGEAQAKQAAQQGASQVPQNARASQNQPNLEVNRPSTQLPETEPKVSLPPPPASTSSAN